MTTLGTAFNFLLTILLYCFSALLVAITLYIVIEIILTLFTGQKKIKGSVKKWKRN